MDNAAPAIQVRRFLAAVVASAALIGLPTTARAGVTGYAAARQISYTQTSNAPPTAPEIWWFLTLVTYDVPDEVLSATVTLDVAPPVTYDLQQVVPTLHAYSSDFYTSEDEFLLTYPATTYTHIVDRGAGPESGDLFVAADLYCAEIPYLTGDTYDRLQSCDSSLAFDGTINGFTLAPGTNVGSTNVMVVEAGVGVVLSIGLQPSETDFQIPAGQLKPGTDYSIGITYLDVVEIADAGFAGATSGAEFHRATSATFTTLPAGPQHRSVLAHKNRKAR